MKATLAIDLSVPAGREVEAAKLLARTLPPDEWAILAALAAEVVQEHEARLPGGAVVVVAGPDQAERVKAELARRG